MVSALYVSAGDEILFEVMDGQGGEYIYWGIKDSSDRQNNNSLDSEYEIMHQKFQLFSQKFRGKGGSKLIGFE